MSNQKTVPTALLIGAQKAGTTYLCELLHQYPDIGVASNSEPHFFTNTWDKGWTWYLGLFPEDRPLTIEKSTTYSFLRPHRDHPGYIADHVGLTMPVLERIREANPDVRLIYGLRNPVKRTISAAQHLLRLDADRSIDELIRSNPMIRLPSYYSSQIDLYRDVFADEQFLFFSSADLYSDTRRVVQQCAEHIGTQHPDIELTLDADPHEKFQVSSTASRIANAITFGRGATWLAEQVRRVPGTSRIRKAVKNQVSVPVSKPSEETIAWLEELYADEIVRVKEMTGIDLSA